ncbi:MAG: radical SAM protein [Aquificaceae bacterium]|nr:radical SAM protein [Aquificaceae bacterium]
MIQPGGGGPHPYLEEVELDRELLQELQEGFQIRLRNFGRDILFHSPGFKHYEVEDFSVRTGPKFVDISITGKNCELMCDHCASKILWHMIPALTPEELWKVANDLRSKGVEGLLISGGSNKDGVVELQPFLEVMKRIKQELGMFVSCHVGLVDKGFAQGLREAEVDAVLIDIIGDDETIAQVYKLPHKSIKDYENSLRLLKEAGHNLVPHVIIGLHYGQIKGEYRAIELIAEYEPSALVLVVVMPYFGKARFQLLPPPKVEESVRVVLHARRALPTRPVVIGCARPAGPERVKFDLYALHAGVNGITFPAEGVFTYAKGLGLNPVVSPNCCSTVFLH